MTDTAYEILLTGALIALGVLAVVVLVRLIIGPRVADRIVSVNMITTIVVMMLGVLAVMIGENYIADICIVYAMLGFIAVIVLTKLYLGIWRERRGENPADDSDEFESDENDLGGKDR